MRNFLSTGFVLFSFFFGAIILSHVPIGLTAHKDVEMWQGADLPFLVSTDNSRAGEQDSIQMEISVPYFILPIPVRKQGFSIPLTFGVSITNTTPNMIRADNDTLTPELVAPDSQVLQTQKARDRQLWATKSCSLVKPGATKHFVPGAISWQNNKLQLRGYAGLGYFWYFEDLQPGTYQLRFTYDSKNKEVSCYDLETQEYKKIEGLGAARGVTPFIPIRIVQPVYVDRNTLEIDGIRFEIVMPERILNISKNQPNAQTSIKLGLRITNKTKTPFRFTRFDSLYLSFIAPDGKLLRQERGRSGTAPPTPSDCPLVQPGESVTFYKDARLSWQSNKFQLGGSDGFGGFWYYDDLKPGTYQTYIAYSLKVPGPPSACDSGIRGLPPLENIWQGFGYTPSVEVRLVQP